MSDDTLARILRARALVALKKPADAMSDLNHVLGVRPGYPDALALLAQAEAKRKIQELSKRLPCGGSEQPGTCL